MTNFEKALRFNGGVLPEGATHIQGYLFYKMVDGVPYVYDVVRLIWVRTISSRDVWHLIRPITVDEVLSTLS